MTLDWMDEGACRTANVDMFPLGAYGTARAIQVCRRCPVRQACLDYTLSMESGAHDRRAGVAGGFSATDRARIWRGDEPLGLSSRMEAHIRNLSHRSPSHPAPATT